MLSWIIVVVLTTLFITPILTVILSITMPVQGNTFHISVVRTCEVRTRADFLVYKNKNNRNKINSELNKKDFIYWFFQLMWDYLREKQKKLFWPFLAVKALQLHVMHLPQPSSSLPFGQSLSPSHFQLFKMHLSPQLNSPSLQVRFSVIK